MLITKAVRDATMAISYQCVCGQAITTREERGGTMEKCPSCRMSNMVPAGPGMNPEGKPAASGAAR